jgi:hypothetical protein
LSRVLPAFNGRTQRVGRTRFHIPSGEPDRKLTGARSGPQPHGLVAVRLERTRIVET